jgi:hypothetical protein
MWTAPATALGYADDILSGGRGFRMFHGQPTAEPIDAGLDADGRQRWRFVEPFSGVTLFGLIPGAYSGTRDPVPATSIDLPGGYTLDLVEGAMPAEALLSFGYAHWIDKGLSLRISRAGVTQAVGYWQHAIPTAGQVRLAAGIYLDAEGVPRVYAHLGEFPVRDTNNTPQPLEAAPTVPNLYSVYHRLASPFGRGVSLTCAAQADALTGAVEIRNAYVTDRPAAAWFLDADPLESPPLPLAPTADAITARNPEGLAWGRQPAAVAVAPVYFRLGEIEAAGHVEWLGAAKLTGWPTFFPGASRLFRGGRMSPVLPPEWAGGPIRTNLDASAVVAARLTTLRASYATSTSSTGSRDLPLFYGAWNEYRPAGWLQAGAATNTAGTVEGVFLGVNLSRVDATNLGGITAQADAVEVTRFVARWLVSIKTRVTDPFGTVSTQYAPVEGAAILSEADGLSLLSGNQITLAGTYTQGTYPAASTVSIPGTFTLQAVG